MANSADTFTRQLMADKIFKDVSDFGIHLAFVDGHTVDYALGSPLVLEYSVYISKHDAYIPAYTSMRFLHDSLPWEKLYIDGQKTLCDADIYNNGL